MELDTTRDDMELVWDPTPDPDDANRIKRGDSFCFVDRRGDPSFIKEYPYTPPVVGWYHALQCRIAERM